MINTRQLTLNFSSETTYNVEDFYISSCNAQAYSWIKRWPDWPSPGIVLYGAGGCGKTHLAYIWQKETQAQFLTLTELYQKNLVDLFRNDKCFILDSLPPLHKEEEILLHLYNLVKEYQGSLLCLSHASPSQWNIKLPDLNSRIQALPAIKIETPDDQLLEALAFKLFSDQQLTVDEPVIHYLLTRSDRSFKGLQNCIVKINTCALAARRNITLPFVREVLRN